MATGNVRNPGSALGEAIGNNMETALNEYFSELVQELNCHIISKGQPNKKTGKHKKLLLYDKHGTGYNIDAVITNESMQPLIVMEYKYIRYKKHNRDKGSWVCTAHSAIRRHYTSVRSSIAILAGNWSGTSMTMMRSHEINLFLIPFSKIVDLLKEHDIVFDWAEKDRETAVESWNTYSALSKEEQLNIGRAMIEDVKPELEGALLATLDDTIPREVKQIIIEVHTNLGEVKTFEFDAIDDAIEFLADFGIDELLSTENAIAIFDGPPSNNDAQLNIGFK